MKILKINGAEKNFEPGQFPETLADLLKYLNVDAATVVAELDGQIGRTRKIFPYGSCRRPGRRISSLCSRRLTYG